MDHSLCSRIRVCGVLTYAYAATGFTRRIVGVPKAESDALLHLLFHQLSENPDFQVRFHWEPNSIAVWDNRVRASSLLALPAWCELCRSVLVLVSGSAWV